MGETARLGRVTRSLMLLLGAAVFLNYVDRGAVGIAAPLMLGDLGLGGTEFGLVASAFSGSTAPSSWWSAGCATGSMSIG